MWTSTACGTWRFQYHCTFHFLNKPLQPSAETDLCGQLSAVYRLLRLLDTQVVTPSHFLQKNPQAASQVAQYVCFPLCTRDRVFISYDVIQYRHLFPRTLSIPWTDTFNPSRTTFLFLFFRSTVCSIWVYSFSSTVGAFSYVQLIFFRSPLYVRRFPAHILRRGTCRFTTRI